MPAKTIIFAVNKGGEAKSTSAIATAYALRYMNHKVLAIDLDPQGNMSQGFGITEDPEENMFHLMTHHKSEVEVKDVIVEAHGLHVLPSSLDLALAEMMLMQDFGTVGSLTILRDLLKPIKNDYDYIVIDSPPSVSVLTSNGLIAADHVLVPIQPGYFALKGAELFMRTYQLMLNHNPNLNFLGFVINRFNKRAILHQQVLELLQKKFPDQVFKTFIRQNITLNEAQAAGKSIYEYAPESNGSQDYAKLTEEILTKLA